MSTKARPPHSDAPIVVARRAGAGRTGAAVVAAAFEDGAALVEVDEVDLAALDPSVLSRCVAVVTDPEAADRALALGVGGLRIDAVGPQRDELVARGLGAGAAVHVAFGRGVAAAAALDVGELDGDAGDDLLGRLAALTDLAAAGRTVIASIGAVGPDDTAALAALATARGAAVLRVEEVAAASRAAAVQAAIGAAHVGTAR